MSKSDTRREIAQRYYQKHREECLARAKKYRTTHPEYYRMKSREWRKNMPPEEKEEFAKKHNDYEKSYYKLHKDEITQKTTAYQKQHPDKRKQWTKNTNHKKKMQILVHYGGNPPKCACCGETKIAFLTIDHINGGGTKHRESIGHGNFYRWLIKNNFPEGYQVLCANCNLGKRIDGVCPHKKELK